jgi:hypothetical protein
VGRQEFLITSSSFDLMLETHAETTKEIIANSKTCGRRRLATSAAFTYGSGLAEISKRNTSESSLNYSVHSQLRAVTVISRYSIREIST